MALYCQSFTSSFNTAITLDSDDVTVLGNLTVQGTQTQLNTATLNIEDKNLLIASGAADSSAASGVLLHPMALPLVDLHLMNIPTWIFLMARV